MDMNKSFKRTKATVIIIGIMLCVLGIAIFANPGVTLQLVTLLLGWSLLIGGIAILVSAIAAHVPGFMSVSIWIGILLTLLGLCIVISPGFFVSYVYVLIGIVIMITGVSDCIEAYDAKKLGLPFSAQAAVFGVISIILGLLVIAAPFSFAQFVTSVAGIALLVDGITEVVAGIKLNDAV